MDRKYLMAEVADQDLHRNNLLLGVLQDEEESRQKAEDAEMAGWTTTAQTQPVQEVPRP